MNFFKELTTSLCATGVFVGILHLISPDGNMSKPVKYVLSLVFLVTVISAAGLSLGGINDIPEFKTENNFSADELNTATAKYVYSYVLEKNGINFSEITVCTDKTQDGSIIISKVYIYSDCEEEKIRAALGAAAENIEVVVINE